MRTSERAAIALVVSALLLWPVPVAAQEETSKPPAGEGETEPGSPGTLEPDRLGIYVSGIVMLASGEEVEAAPAGSETLVRIELSNGGDETLRGVTASIGSVRGARVIDGEASYGDLVPGAAASGEFAIEVSASECPDFLALTLAVSSGAEVFEVSADLPALCPGPRLHIAGLEFRGADGDGVPEPGEAVDLYISLMNTGRDPATTVRATVKIESEGAGPLTVESTWPDIAPEGSATNGSPVRIQISEDAPLQEGCEGPLPLPIDEVPGDPDEPVTSDDPGVTLEGPDGRGSSTGGGEPGSDGEVVVSDDEAVQEESDPPLERGIPEGEPAPPGFGVVVEGQAEVTAAGYSETLFFSTGIACALTEPAADDGDGAERLEDAAAEGRPTYWLIVGAAGIAVLGGGAGAGALLLRRRRAAKHLA